jgi:hypothetical protein
MSELISYGDLSDQPSSQTLQAALHAKESNALEVYRYGVGAAARSQMDQSDTEAGHDAADTAMNAELDLLSIGLAKAAGSAAGVEIVAGWVGHLSRSNHQRFSRRFGG